jgi:hypothetical protein
MIRPLALLLSSWLLLALPAVAQEVFVTRGAGSPVYSDRPQAGGKPVTLPELNVSKPVPVAKAAPPLASPLRDDSGGATAAPAYRRFSIVSPANDGSVAANTAIFEVRVAVEPPLQLGDGHAILVSINGRPVGQRFTANEFMIPPEFWGDTLPPANQRHQVDAVIVDQHGAVLTRAEPVTFHLRYVEGRQQRPWPRPLPVYPLKPTLPAPPEKNPAVKRFEQPGRPFFER